MRRTALLLRALAIISLGGTGLEGGEAWSSIEAKGDAEWRHAVPHYEAAMRAWERVSSRAARIADGAAADRSWTERARLSLLLRDAKLLELARNEVAGALKSAAVEPPVLLVKERSGLEDASLERLEALLGQAGRRATRAGGQPGMGGLDERDGLIIGEAEALVARIRGDLHLERADCLYRQALEGARPQAGTRPSLARLLYKLRDFNGAAAEFAAMGADLGGLAREEAVELLHSMRVLNLFRGDLTRAAALRDMILARSGKEEEPVRPGAKLPGFVVGSAVDLAETVHALVAIINRSSLPRREKAVASLLAGQAAAELGELALSEEILRGAEPEAEDWLEASLDARLGMARVELGDYEVGLQSLERAKSALARLERAEVFRARNSLNLARALIALGQLERARAETLEVLDATTIPADLKIRSRILLGAVLYEEAREAPERLGDAAASFQAAARSLETARAGKECVDGADELGASIAINRANVLRLEARALAGDAARARLKEAVQLQDEALRTAEKAGLWPLAAVAAANLGELCLESGDTRAAKGFVDWAQARASEHRLFETEWRCRWYRGRMADAEGNTALADGEYAAAADLVESYRSKIFDAEKKSGFLTDKMALYRDIVRREIARGRPERALEAAERAKARALVDSLGWRFVALADPQESELYREYVGLLARAESLRAGGSSSFLGVKTRALDHDALRSRLAAVRARIAGREGTGFGLRALVDGDPSGAAAVRRDLPPSSTLVEYFSLGERMVALLVTPEGVEVFALETSPAAIDRLTAAFLRSSAEDAVSARGLYTALLAPFAGRVTTERLIVVPFGGLHQLPFEALRDENGYLVARWDIVYLPSASVLKYLRPRGRLDPDHAALLAVVDPDTDYNRDGKPDLPPLLHAREEVAALSRSFARSNILSGSSAMEAKCPGSTDFDVLHYACHGEFFPSRPWESTLFLAPGPSADSHEDGRLKAWEVYGLDLRRCRFVALSGCETGRSRLGPGDDPVSIGTAFLHSGASSLLVSLWKVEDRATAALMKAFYSKWIRDGKDKGRALRESKLELLAGSFPRPRQWGAFVLMGEP